MNIAEEDILEKALEAFELETGRRAQQKTKQLHHNDRTIDAVIELNDVLYNAEIKKWAQHANLGALIHQYQAIPGNALLIADYINRKLAVRLKNAGVQFIDTAGNAYIQDGDFYINVRGNDMRPELHTMTQGRQTGRAFTTTGMKVVYLFIRHPELIEEPYREIAECADVALGTVGRVVNDLKAQGIVIDSGGHKYFKDIKDLRDKWVEMYPLKLRPKQKLGEFTAEDPFWWKHFDAGELDAQWGGETGAALLTRHLKPQIATVYLKKENIGELVQAVRLRRASNAEEVNVELMERFWPYNGNEVAPPLVVYADLIATGNPRNLETARIIYDKLLNRPVPQD